MKWKDKTNPNHVHHQSMSEVTAKEPLDLCVFSLYYFRVGTDGQADANGNI